MSKNVNKIKKNITKNKEKEKNEYPIKNKIMSFVNIFFGIFILVILAIIVSLYTSDKYKFDDIESEISYEEIIAGQTFNKKNNEYYVVFYEFGTEEELDSALKTAKDKKTIYQVNLKNTMNKQVVSNKSNPKASKTEDLKINGTTIIKIKNGKNVEYIEGTEKVVRYLHSL